MGSVNYIFANTGQTVSLIIQSLDVNGYVSDLTDYRNWLDGYGYWQDGYYSEIPDGYYPDGYFDGYYLPVVDKVIFPDLTESELYPLPLIRIDTGLYIYSLQIPRGVPSIGSYIVYISYFNNMGNYILETYSVNAARPFGISSVTPI
jgi:hypothetical protein